MQIYIGNVPEIIMMCSIECALFGVGVGGGNLNPSNNATFISNQFA